MAAEFLVCVRLTERVSYHLRLLFGRNKNNSLTYKHNPSITQLRNALRLSMALHRAVIRQGSSLIDKRSIRTMRGHRVVLISQGPDLSLFSHPGTLARLARWLVDAMRERISGSKMAFSAPGGVNAHNADKGKSLPFVVACLDERRGVYTVVGVNAALEFGDVRKK